MLRNHPMIAALACPIGLLGIATGCDGPVFLPCMPTFFSQEAGGGFSPPADHTGPVDAVIRQEWTAPGGTNPSFTFFSSPSLFFTSADAGAITAQLVIGIDPNLTIVRNEEITLDSGRKGWLITYTDNRAPTDVIGVSVDLVQNGMQYRVRGFGDAADGTNDFDFLISVARTLCAG